MGDILRLKNTNVAAQTLTAISGDLIRVVSIVIATDVYHILPNAKFCGQDKTKERQNHSYELG